MRTIKTYQNGGEAGFAQSLLNSMGIHAILPDEHACVIGGMSVLPEGFRLQVEDGDAEQALRVLNEQEGFSPLPDDFVEPERAPGAIDQERDS
jgi:hypothetical protein